MSPPAPSLSATWIRSALRSTEWVDATPFRAHLHYLVAASGLSGRVIANHCGIPLRLADRLLAVGDSAVRRARRISHAHAARLLAVEPRRLAALRCSQVDATATWERLDRLRERRHAWRDIAQVADALPAELELLHRDRWPTCSQLVALQVRAAAQILLGDADGIEPDPKEDLMVRRAG